MDSTLYIEKSENELELAKIIFKITEDKKIQENIFEISEPITFFSAVITHSYYSIFYAVKAYLTEKGIKTSAPEEHKKTYEEFKKIVEQGIIDLELLKMYEEIMIKADTLLEIFRTEKKKRGQFTYQKLPQANKEPAENSLKNAKTLFRHIYNLIQEKKEKQ